MGFAIAAAAVSAGASAYGANQQAGASAANQAYLAQVAQSNNAANLQLFLQSRGKLGNSLLPLYLKNPDGTPFESTLGQNAVSTYDAAQGGLTPAQQIAFYTQLASQFQPTLNSANTTAQGIFNGNLTNQELSNEAPVAAARQTSVTSQKEASLEGLQQTLNDIKSIQAGQGYTGDSFGNNLLKANAIRTTNTANAALQGGADLQTAQEQQGIKETGINRQLSNLNLPSSMFAENAAFSAAPANAAISQQENSQSLLNMFKLTPTAFQNSAPPITQPIPTNGQIAGQGVGALSSAVGNLAASNTGVFASGTSPSASVTGFNLNAPAPNYYDTSGGLSLSNGAGLGIDPSAVGQSQAIYQPSLSLGGGN